MSLFQVLLFISAIFLVFIFVFYLRSIDKFISMPYKDKRPGKREENIGDIEVEDKEYFKELEQDKLKWEAFMGMKNTDDVITAKAMKLSEQLVAFAVSYSNGISQVIKTDTADLIATILFIEMLVLLLHAIDRISFVLLGIEKRKIFMDSLMENIIIILRKAYGDKAEEVINTFTGKYNERQVEYSSLRLPGNNEQNFGGTLFWEFGKIILNIFGFQWDLEPELLLKLTILPQTALIRLNIPSLLEGD